MASSVIGCEYGGYLTQTWFGGGGTKTETKTICWGKQTPHGGLVLYRCQTDKEGADGKGLRQDSL